MMHLRGILLDIDGTLVESNEAHAQSWRIACAELGFERPVEFFRPLIGMGSDRVFPQIDERLKDDEAPGTGITARRANIFRERYLPTLRPTNGAKPLVERLKRAGLRCIVATSASQSDLDDLLDVAGIESLISIRTTSDDAAESKPAGDIIDAALRKGGLSPAEAILIGDTPYDIEAGARVGVPVVALRCGGWKDADLAEAIERYDDPADLLAKFEQSAIGRRLSLK